MDFDDKMDLANQAYDAITQLRDELIDPQDKRKASEIGYAILELKVSLRVEEAEKDEDRSDDT